MDYFLTLVVNGLMSGAVYALVGAAFVVVYRASSVLNFSLGEWVGLGARLTGIGVQALGLPAAGALAGAVAAMFALALAFNALVIRKLVSRPIVAVVMATLALGVLMRGGAALGLAGIPSEIPFPLADQLWFIWEIPVAPSRLIAGGTALILILAALAFFRFTRIGIVIRAVSDDPTAATAVGISVVRSLGLCWGLSAAMCVAGGVLWSIEGHSSFGMSLVLAKVLPVVVIGGLTSFIGAVIGAMIVGVAESLAAGYLDQVVGTGTGGAIAAVLIIVMLWVRPTGLFGATAVERV